MKSKKRAAKFFAATLLFVLTAITFSGCIKVERGVEFKLNGTVEGKLDIKVSEDMLFDEDQKPEDVIEDMTKGIDGIMELKSYEETIDAKKWYGFAGSCAVPKEMAGSMISTLVGENYDVSYANTGFIMKKIQITVVKKPEAYNPASESLDEESASYAKMMGFSDEFSIKVPSKIVSTNGTLDPLDNTRATWDLYMYEMGNTPDTTKYMTVTYMNWIPVYIAAGVFGVIILSGVAIAVVNIVKIVRRKKESFPLYGAKPSNEYSDDI